MTVSLFIFVFDSDQFEGVVIDDGQGFDSPEPEPALVRLDLVTTPVRRSAAKDATTTDPDEIVTIGR